jgi:hypothetical protein
MEEVKVTELSKLYLITGVYPNQVKKFRHINPVTRKYDMDCAYFISEGGSEVRKSNTPEGKQDGKLGGIQVIKDLLEENKGVLSLTPYTSRVLPEGAEGHGGEGGLDLLEMKKYIQEKVGSLNPEDVKKLGYRDRQRAIKLLGEKSNGSAEILLEKILTAIKK